MEPRDVPVSLALAALSATVGLAFGRVFAGERWIAPLVVAAVLPHVLAALARALRQPPAVELTASASALVLSILIAAPGGPDPGAVLDRVRAGWAVVRVHSVPLPPRAGIIVLAAVVVWVVAASSDALAFRRDASLGAVAPGVVVVIWCIALGTQEDRWLSVGAFGVAVVVFLALQHQRLLERHRTHLGPTRAVLDSPRLLVVGVLAGTLAVGMGIAGAVALPGADRPLVDTEGLGERGGGARSYRTQVPPLLDVGDKLRQQDVQQLFTVQADEADYWRITALDEYRSDAGGQWALTAEGEDAVGTGLDERVPRDALVQRYTIGPLSERWMPAAYRPVRVSRPETLVVRASSTLVTGRDSVAGLQYRVTSATPRRNVDAADPGPVAKVPRELAQYTELPGDLSPVVADTARSVTAGLDAPIEQATALRDFFRSGAFTYDPEVRLGDDEAAVGAFLRDRRGFCVQFATAYALMARALGIPARVAVGFTPGTRDEATGTFTVTNHDAHAWPEIWLAGLGWTNLFDPTPPSDLPGGSGLGTEPAPVTPTTTATTPPTTTGSPATAPPSSVPGGSAPQSQPRDGGVRITAENTAESGGGALWPLLVPAAVLALFLAPIAAVLISKRRRRSRRRASPDARHAIVGAWHELIDTLTDHRIPTSASETPYELAARVPADAGDDAGPALHSLAEVYTHARYATEPPRSSRATEAWRDVDEVRRALDAGQGLLARLRARLSPRTLGRSTRDDDLVSVSTEASDRGAGTLRRSESTHGGDQELAG
jgi:transglutaminase-like putative cysteine protease